MIKTDWTLDEALAVTGPTGHTTSAQLWTHLARLRKAKGDTIGADRAKLAAATAKYSASLAARRNRQQRCSEK